MTKSLNFGSVGIPREVKITLPDGWFPVTSNFPLLKLTRRPAVKVGQSSCTQLFNRSVASKSVPVVLPVFLLTNFMRVKRLSIFLPFNCTTVCYVVWTSAQLVIQAWIMEILLHKFDERISRENYFWRTVFRLSCKNLLEIFAQSCSTKMKILQIKKNFSKLYSWKVFQLALEQRFSFKVN